MKICSKCGQPGEEIDIFCINCGGKMIEVADAPAGVAAPDDAPTLAAEPIQARASSDDVPVEILVPETIARMEVPDELPEELQDEPADNASQAQGVPQGQAPVQPFQGQDPMAGYNAGVMPYPAQGQFAQPQEFAQGQFPQAQEFAQGQFPQVQYQQAQPYAQMPQPQAPYPQMPQAQPQYVQMQQAQSQYAQMQQAQAPYPMDTPVLFDNKKSEKPAKSLAKDSRFDPVHLISYVLCFMFFVIPFVPTFQFILGRRQTNKYSYSTLNVVKDFDLFSKMGYKNLTTMGTVFVTLVWVSILFFVVALIMHFVALIKILCNRKKKVMKFITLCCLFGLLAQIAQAASMVYLFQNLKEDYIVTMKPMILFIVFAALSIIMLGLSIAFKNAGKKQAE